MKIPSKIIFIIFGFILLLIVVVVLLPANENNERELNPNINYEKLDEVVFNVKVKEIIKSDLIKSITANGIVKAFSELDVVSNITGYVDKISIYEGKQVGIDDMLIKFDDREYKIAVNEAEVNLMNAKIEYGFFKKEDAQTVINPKADSISKEINLLETRFRENKIGEKEYLSNKEILDIALLFTGAKRDEVLLNKSGMTNALNNMNRAKLNLSYTEIKAPFNGVVGDFKLVTKQRINAGEKLFKLLDVSKLKIEVGVIESEISKIKVGNKAEVKINSLSDKSLIGKVVFVNPLIDPETKTCRVTVEIPNQNQNIKPGMFASLTIETEILKNRILIPKSALLVRDKRDLVFIVEDKFAKWHYVQVGEQNEDYIEILDGVKPGDMVIVDGHYNLAHDSKINIIR